MIEKIPKKKLKKHAKVARPVLEAFEGMLSWVEDKLRESSQQMRINKGLSTSASKKRSYTRKEYKPRPLEVEDTKNEPILKL